MQKVTLFRKTMDGDDSHSKNGLAAIGIVVSSDSYTGNVVIQEVMSSGAAYNSGQVFPGDTLLQINGASIMGMEVNQIQELLSGEPGTPVSIIVSHNLRALMPQSHEDSIAADNVPVLVKSKSAAATRNANKQLQGALVVELSDGKLFRINSNGGVVELPDGNVVETVDVDSQVLACPFPPPTTTYSSQSSTPVSLPPAPTKLVRIPVQSVGATVNDTVQVQLGCRRRYTRMSGGTADLAAQEPVWEKYLDDPMYYDPRHSDMTTPLYCGVGITFARCHPFIVKRLRAGGLAEKKGVIKVGDLLEKVDKAPLQPHLTSDQVRAMVIGPKNSVVEMQFRENPKRTPAGAYHVRLIRDTPPERILRAGTYENDAGGVELGARRLFEGSLHMCGLV